MKYERDHLLIDVKNCFYRAIYAGLSDTIFMRNKHDFAVIFFRFMNTYINNFKPRSVHLFWDTPKENVWRRDLYQEYKGDRKHKSSDAEMHLKRCSDIINAIVPFLNCYSYYVERQEADDLIYAFCKVNPTAKITIISSDADLRQLAYQNDLINLYNPVNKKMYVQADSRQEQIDPIELKCLSGDKTDNIDGYDQIGEVRAKLIIEDVKRRQELYKNAGSEKYQLNRKLIDLSLNPYVLGNMMYIHDVMARDVVFSMKDIITIIQTYKVRGLRSEFSSTVLTFKLLEK